MPLRVGKPPKAAARQVRRSTPSERIARARRRSIAVGLTLLTTWVLAGILLFVDPPADSPQLADVLFVLGPPDDRLAYAEQLMQEGVAGTLAVSSPVDRAGQFTAPVCHATRSYQIICFDPEPFTTQGEARALRDLTVEYGWQSVNVIAPQHHVTRARVIMDRCYKGDLRVIKYDAEVPLHSWVYLYLYHTAAFVKVALNPDC